VVDLTLGEKPHFVGKPAGEKVFATEFVYCHPGVFDHLENVDALKENGIIDVDYCFHSAGTTFDGIDSSGDRVAGFSIVADSKDELEAKHRVAAQKLTVVSTEGKDMTRRDLLTDLY
jgi:hypothetical protein